MAKREILSTIKRLGVFRPKDLEARGIPRKALYPLVEEGLVDRISRGLFIAETHKLTVNHSLVQAAHLVPHGVVCLLSALRFHELTTQAPFEVWIAIAEKARKPRVEFPRIHVVRFSRAGLNEGIERHQIEGVALRITSPARTVVDCFRYRNKIGIDVAVEALKDFTRRHRTRGDELARLAHRFRASRVMQPYLDSIT